MNQVLLGSLVFTVVRCESELAAVDRGIVHGIAAKIGSSPTILKVFINGDIQEEDIERLLNIYPREEKLPNGPVRLTRNRRNSIADYIGKVYSFNGLLRPYRSIFRGFKHDETTPLPWLKKFLGGVRSEPRTESFWGMALGAHTFSPMARPLAHTRMPYHRIRNQQSIDKLLGITRNYQPTVADDCKNQSETIIVPISITTYWQAPAKPYHWIKDQHKYDKYVVQARHREEPTTSEIEQNATTRKAFHRAPFDVAGLRMNLSHLHSITTPRRLKFCEKQCEDEKEEAKTHRPENTEGGRTESANGPQRTTPNSQKATEDGTTEECTCTVEQRCSYCSGNGEPQRDCPAMVIKKVSRTTAQTEKQTGKMTTWKYTRPKEERLTGAMWTLPPNSVLDQKQPEEQRGHRHTTFNDRTSSGSTPWFAITGSPERSTRAHAGHEPAPTTMPSAQYKSRCTCKKQRQTTLCMLQCPHLLIPTRIQNLICPTTKQSCSTESTTCWCQANPPQDIPVSIGETLDQSQNPDQNKGKPQKIVVRISSALGEVPVVIMRDNGVSGVSLSLVNDYILDENNRLIKCLGQKPVGRHTAGNSSSRPKPKILKGKHFIPQLIRHHLHGLQPRRYSFKLRSKPARKLLAGNSNEYPYPGLSQIAGIPVPNALSYKIDSPGSPRMDGFALPMVHFPGLQYPRRYGSFTMPPYPLNRPDQKRGPMDQIMDEFARIGSTEYPRFKFEDDLSRFEQRGLNQQPAFPQRPDTSQLLGYRSPIFPIFYPGKNYIPPPKYIVPGLQ